MLLRAALRNSHEDGGRTFLISVTDPRTIRLYTKTRQSARHILARHRSAALERRDSLTWFSEDQANSLTAKILDQMWVDFRASPVREARRRRSA